MSYNVVIAVEAVTAPGVRVRPGLFQVGIRMLEPRAVTGVGTDVNVTASAAVGGVLVWQEESSSWTINYGDYAVGARHSAAAPI
jgi:hypothetical protein